MLAAKDELFTRPSGGYTIARSVRTRSSASGYFNRTLTTPTNNKIWTWSAWVKRGILGTQQFLLNADNGSATSAAIDFLSDAVRIYFVGGVYQVTTTQVFRDPSAWYHIIFAIDTTQATDTNRVKVYVNGNQVTSFATAVYPLQNLNGAINSAVIHTIAYNGVSLYFDGYLTEINFIDGQQLTSSSFGTTNPSTGVWQPKKYTGTYGTNGFYLNFSDNSSNTATTIGKDYSGNGNNWTPNNISVTAGVTYDSMVDSPTVGATSSNYCVINPLDTQNASSVAQGNQYISFSAVNYGHSRATMSIPDGSYWEVVAGGSNYLMLGVANSTTYSSFNWAGSWAIYQGDGKVYNNGAAITGVLATFTTNDVIGFAVKGNKLYIAKNNTWLNSGDPVAQTGSVASSLSSEIFPYIGNGGGAAGTPSAYFNAGQRPFSYTPPTGYVALNTYNLPTSTITNGSAYMNAVARSGTGATATVAIAFQPDWIWSKCRTNAVDNILADSNRGLANTLFSNLTLAEDTTNAYAFTTSSTGYGFNGTNGINGSGRTYVDWVWKAGGTAASNTNGSITSTVSAGATQGFSVVTYTGNGTNNATIGHGLGVTPSMVIVKSRTSSIRSWFVAHTSLATNNNLLLQTTDIAYGPSAFGSGVVGGLTSTVFECIPGTIAPNNVANINTNGENLVAYCFAAVAGFSAFGGYTGNGDPSGPFVYLGFRPRFVMIKRTDSANNWVMFDTSRDTYNAIVNTLAADSTNTEAAFGAGYNIDFLSNGFKPRNTTGAENASGGTYIYMAFAENPFKNALAR